MCPDSTSPNLFYKMPHNPIGGIPPSWVTWVVCKVYPICEFFGDN